MNAHKEIIWYGTNKIIFTYSMYCQWPITHHLQKMSHSFRHDTCLKQIILINVSYYWYRQISELYRLDSELCTADVWLLYRTDKRCNKNIAWRFSASVMASIVKGDADSGGTESAQHSHSGFAFEGYVTLQSALNVTSSCSGEPLGFMPPCGNTWHLIWSCCNTEVWTLTTTLPFLMKTHMHTCVFSTTQMCFKTSANALDLYVLYVLYWCLQLGAVSVSAWLSGATQKDRSAPGTFEGQADSELFHTAVS